MKEEPQARVLTSTGDHFDFTIHDRETSYVIEVKSRVRALRDLRARLLKLAILTGRHNATTVLVLADALLTDERLHATWHDFTRVVRPEIANRLGLIVTREGTLNTTFGSVPNKELVREIVEMVEVESSWHNKEAHGRIVLPKPTTSLVVCKILLVRWFARQPPVQTQKLMELAGCSYPTVAAALKRLGRTVSRGPRKSVSLNRFPYDVWQEIVAHNRGERFTLRYADVSGQPRSVKSLRSRLVRLKNDKIAIGGTLGARHWFPSLNVHGDPRLDLSIHAPGAKTTVAFVSRLDPALKRQMDPSASASIALHFVRRANPLFQQPSSAEDSTPMRWADPIECLLDLLEMKLNEEAEEFLDHLIEKARE